MCILPYIPILEVLFFNLLAIDHCCHKKRSGMTVVLVLFLFSVLFFAFSLANAKALAFRGDGRLSFGGFIYIVPMGFLYREKPLLLFAIICTCWTYTLGILALTFQIAGILLPGSLACVLVVENLLFIGTIFPFYRHIIPKYVFVVVNLPRFETRWYKYMALSTSLSFLLLMVINAVFIAGESSLLKIAALALLLISTHVSYFIIYRIVLNSLRLGQLEYAAFHDPLTDLGNRKQLEKHLQELLDAEDTFSVLFMDLDHFKAVNDQYGHLAGDQYLRQFAKISRELLLSCGRVFRFGGDEFAAVYYGTVPDAQIHRLAECMGWDAGAPCPFNGVSIGVIHCRPPHKDVELILRQADQIMYQNKLNRACPSQRT